VVLRRIALVMIVLLAGVLEWALLQDSHISIVAPPPIGKFKG
jgi:hypothetical protein